MVSPAWIVLLLVILLVGLENFVGLNWFQYLILRSEWYGLICASSCKCCNLNCGVLLIWEPFISESCSISELWNFRLRLVWNARFWNLFYCCVVKSLLLSLCVNYCIVICYCSVLVQIRDIVLYCCVRFSVIWFP
jgi:hypothetical protein